MERGEKFFRIKVGNKEQVVTVDRLKPAFGFADPAPLSPAPRKIKATIVKVEKKKKSLNPAAEIFIPGPGPRESPTTELKSRFGRTRRPPERLGISNNF